MKSALAVLARELGISSLATIDELRNSLHPPFPELGVPRLESIDESENALHGPRFPHKCSHCGAMCSQEEASAMQKKQRHDANLQHGMVDMVAAPADEIVEMVEEKGGQSRVSSSIHSGQSTAKPDSNGKPDNSGHSTSQKTLMSVPGSNELSGGQSFLGGGTIWNRFLAANRSQDDASSSIISFKVCAPSTWATAIDSFRALLREVRRKALVAAHHPDIWLTGLLMLVVLLLASLGSLLVWANETTDTMRRHAQASPPSPRDGKQAPPPPGKKTSLTDPDCPNTLRAVSRAPPHDTSLSRLLISEEAFKDSSLETSGQAARMIAHD